MNFWQYLESEDREQLKGLSESLAERFAELMGRGHSVADLVAHYGTDFGHLPAEQLQVLATKRRTWQGWRSRLQQLQQARARANLPPLPPSALRLAPTPDQLDALVRTARLSPRADWPDEEAWVLVLNAGAQLWRACIGLARKEGQIRCVAAGSRPAAVYADLIRRQEVLGEVAPHRWLAMRRGAREGALGLTLELPREAMLTQLVVHQGALGERAAERSAESLLQELVLDDIEPWLWRIFDQEAEAKAISAACESLVGLLRPPPFQARRVGAVFIGRPNAAIGAVVADRDGELLSQRVVKADGPWTDKVVEFFREYNVHQVILPSATPGTELLNTLEQALAAADLSSSRARVAAIAEARIPLTSPPQRLGVSVASALVLARRVLDPVKEWAAIDPVSIGVAEYQNDLDEERLRAALKETLELSRLERRRNHRPTPAPAMTPRVAGGNAARLNPLVKSINDLRSGMTVHGVITNISHFGAFVNLGLPQEALVHISELSDTFVANPNEVVSIGQQVTAHILSVDAGRGRISLSMKSQRRAPEREIRGGAEPASARPKPQSRAEALASLERLFKK